MEMGRFQEPILKRRKAGKISKKIFCVYRLDCMTRHKIIITVMHTDTDMAEQA